MLFLGLAAEFLGLVRAGPLNHSLPPELQRLSCLAQSLQFEKLAAWHGDGTP